MMDPRTEKLAALFDEAVSSPEARRLALIAEVKTDDPALAEDLASLLDANDSSAEYFDDLSRDIVSPAYQAVTGKTRRDPAILQQLQAALEDRFRILDELGGGMSRVFLAEEIKLGRKIVLKVLPPEMAVGEAAERFRREIHVAARLQHPHIVPLLSSDSAGPFLYYTMPFVAGVSLRERLSREGPLSVRDAVETWRDILSALAHAHSKGVVHRDIKPANILLSEGSALVSDFGIAHAIEVAGGDSITTSPGLAIGTPAYMAPEQVLGEGTGGGLIDIYASALVMFEMLEGKPPFGGQSSRDVALARINQAPPRISREDCPEALADVVAQCLEREPSHRPQSATEVLQSLDGAPLRSRRVLTKRRMLYTVGAAAAAAVAIVFAAQSFTDPATPGATTDPLAGEKSPGIRRYKPSIEAYELYQRAMDVGLTRSRPGRAQALDYLRGSIAADSNFAAAYAAQVRLYLGEGGGNVDEGVALAYQAGLKAVALDDSLAEAHAGLGWAHLGRYEWKLAEASFKRALALDPGVPHAHEGLARTYLWIGPPDQQLAMARAGAAADPFSHSAIRELALALSMNGRCDEAIERLRPLKMLTPPAGVAGVVMGQCYAIKRMYPEAIAEFRWAMANSDAQAALGMLGYTLARAGQLEEAAQIRDDLISGKRNSHGAFGIALLHAGLGDFDKAFASLEKAGGHSIRVYIMTPMFEELQRDPRFARVKARLRISESVTQR